jgi:ribulose-5-phosphate 4-epimerase/fuculose-1-phosphate aldolase
MAGFLGPQVPNFDIENVYTASDPRDMLINNVRLGAALAATFGRNVSQPTAPACTTVLQRGHGFVTVGKSVEQVTDFAYYAASNARVQTKAILLNGALNGNGGVNGGYTASGGGGNGNETGGVKYLTQQEKKDTANMNAWIVFKPWGQWVREVERSGRYVNDLGTPPLGDGGD